MKSTNQEGEKELIPISYHTPSYMPFGIWQYLVLTPICVRRFVLSYHFETYHSCHPLGSFLFFYKEPLSSILIHWSSFFSKLILQNRTDKVCVPPTGNLPPTFFIFYLKMNNLCLELMVGN